jgi:DNA integrity scanning protein DisA with diadenylate cyclase activity
MTNKLSKEDLKAKEIERKILDAALEVCKKGEGALFVIGENVKYERLIQHKIEPFNVLDKGGVKILTGIAMIDGAVIINKEGSVVDYAVLIKNSRAFLGYGTRHAAALKASKNGNTAILCSEEEKKIKIFKNGKYIMQVDSLEKGIDKKTDHIATILETLGAGLLGTIGVAAVAPPLGVALLPGVIVFGGSYLALKKILSKK